MAKGEEGAHSVASLSEVWASASRVDSAVPETTEVVVAVAAMAAVLPSWAQELVNLRVVVPEDFLVHRPTLPLRRLAELMLEVSQEDHLEVTVTTVAAIPRPSTTVDRVVRLETLATMEDRVVRLEVSQMPERVALPMLVPGLVVGTLVVQDHRVDPLGLDLEQGRAVVRVATEEALPKK